MAEQPNILIILADQLRRQALSCYGDPNIDTKNMDGLAQQGVRFNQACSSFPVCVPFRFSLMTGHAAHTRGMPSIGYRMSPAERTLADVWNASGYHTAYVGKWHLYAGGHGTLPGFDNITTNRIPVPRAHQGRWQKWFGFELANAHFDTCYFEDDDPTPRPIQGYQTDGLFDLTMDYLGQRRDAAQPFACVLSVEPPHPPYEAPPSYEKRWLAKELKHDPSFLVPDPALDRYQGRGDLIDPARRDDAVRAAQLYYAMVENLDDNVGRMMRFLDESGLRDNTIVVVLADHGHCGYRHCWQQKTIPYEESIGIPLIISDPTARAHWGETCDEVTCSEDLFPTLLGLTGTDFDGKGAGGHESLPGLDASGFVRGRTEPLPRDGILIQNTHILRPDLTRFDKGWRGLRTARHKYTIEGGIEGGAEPWQFYDLHEDPYELNNLVADPNAQELVKAHHIMLVDRLAQANDDYPIAEAFGVPGANVPGV